MKYFFTILFFPALLFAQSKYLSIHLTENSGHSISVSNSADNIIYIEMFGNSGVFSLNYERMILDNLSVRLGGGYDQYTHTSNSGSKDDYLSGDLLVIVNYLFAINKNNYLEAGAGLFMDIENTPTFSVGYRYSPYSGGFFFKVTFDIKPHMVDRYHPYGGIGIGFKF